MPKPHVHFPKSLISFRKLRGGQFGTLDVSVRNPLYVQLALGSDFVSLTRTQWVALRSVVDRFFGTETETVIVEDFVGDEEDEVVVSPPLRPAQRPRRRSANG